MLRRPNWNSSDHDPEEFRLSLVGHLEELRKRVIRSVVFLIAGFTVGWWFFKPLFSVLTDRAAVAVNATLKPLGKTYSEVSLHMPDLFFLKFKFSAYIGLVIALPFIVVELWNFIAPGLKPSEQKPFKRLAPASGFLFLLGAFFAWLVLPQAFSWFAAYIVEFSDVAITQEVGSMAMLSLKTLLAFGIGFQLPLVVFVLGALNLLSAQTLMKYWRHAAVAIFFLAGAITPSNDPVSMLAIAIPMTGLFAISVVAVKHTQKGRPPEAFLWSDPEELPAGNDSV
jgi:sec-independent protein translocase protein TatC